jgi:pimeloyl-ACP methyl ester carboxylesterase
MGSGPGLYFAHANGYPPAAYRPLLERLARHYRVIASPLRPLWSGARPEELADWGPLADDLASLLAANSRPPRIGLGHSVGGTTTLRAALHRPELFQALVLIDPVILLPWMMQMWRLIYRLGLAYRLHPLIPSALRRRRVFASPQVMFENYRRKQVFHRIADPGLQAYVQALARPRPDGQVELSYSPEWEARIYATGARRDMDIWNNLKHLKPPLMILYGAESETFRAQTARQVQRRLPGVVIHSLPQAGHLVALEQPEAIYRLALDFLQSISA